MNTPLQTLIVEDSADDTLLVVSELRRGNFEPIYERVETAEAMQAALVRQDWEIILTDHSMINFGAPGVLEVLQQSGRHIPLILVSGGIKAEEAVRLLKAGVRDYINKGDLTRLVPTIRRELREAEINRQQRRSEEQLRLLGTAVSAAANAIFITDSRGEIQWTNAAFCQLSGYGPDDLIGKSLRVLKSGVQSATFYDELWRTILEGQVWTGEVVERRKDGSLYTVHETITPLLQEGGSISHFVVVHEDITRRQAAEAKVEYLAYYDPLTELPNRALFLDRLAQALVRARRDGRLVALLYLDLDQFKVVNDTLGHTSADLVLKEVAERLKRCIRGTDSIARLGGDEFAIIQTDLASVDGAARLAENILRILARPCSFNGHEIHPTSSIGITFYPLDDPYGNRLLENADMALYLAKTEGKNRYAFFTQSLNTEARARRDVETGLTLALLDQQLVIYYQPQVDLKTGAIVGVEGLIRWQHPTRGLLLPAAFLSVAEATGLILPITDFILRKGCAQIRAWHLASSPGWRLALNISATHFRNSLLLQSVTAALASSRLEPQYLELELTESALIHDEGSAIGIMRELQGLGVLLSVDDFGTGYSSLKYLKRLPVNRLKIDQSFVRNLPHDPDDAAIVRAIITLGHELGLHVIAEGVETDDQLAFLRDHGCDEGQGYFFFHPMPPEAIQRLLEKDHCPQATPVGFAGVPALPG